MMKFCYGMKPSGTINLLVQSLGTNDVLRILHIVYDILYVTYVGLWHMLLLNFTVTTDIKKKIIYHR